jgi:hypothetical protein
MVMARVEMAIATGAKKSRLVGQGLTGSDGVFTANRWDRILLLDSLLYLHLYIHSHIFSSFFFFWVVVIVQPLISTPPEVSKSLQITLNLRLGPLGRPPLLKVADIADLGT